MKRNVTILAGIRTPFSKMGSDLAALSAADLGQAVVAALLAKFSVDPARIDEVILGCVGQPADSMNIARVVALRAGVPEHVPAVTVHRNCASGFEAVTTAAERIATGRGKVYLVGGTESMSQAPIHFGRGAAKKFAALAKARDARSRLAALARFRPSDFKPHPALLLALRDPFSGLGMGETAEILAREDDISRDAQDSFALRSHQRAAAARDFLDGEIAPVYPPGSGSATADNGIRESQTLEALAKLRPVFDKATGTVTAGNSSQLTDGAVALLVGDEDSARQLGIEPLGFLTGYAYTGCDPARMGLGPVSAIAEANRRTGRTLADADLVEINEAFAAQTLAVLKRLDGEAIPDDNLNPNGGAIALGHPVGATGARLVLTALRELQRRGGKRALVSLCVGGGQGAALWLERNP
ncbi:acetyl-CoA C-acetyltransferase [soil metagenome]